MDEIEAIASYKALIRLELKLAPGSDVLQELALRLAPEDPQERPPARAPGIARLAAAAQALRNGAVPDVDFERFAEDLRFLRAFERDSLPGDALEALLSDVRAAGRRPGSKPKDDARRSSVVRFANKQDAPEDA
jgi:hypothetical protein